MNTLRVITQATAPHKSSNEHMGKRGGSFEILEAMSQKLPSTTKRLTSKKGAVQFGGAFIFWPVGL